MPSAPCACAATLRPNRCAVSTIAFISSSNSCWPSPPAMLLFTPPVAVNLMTSAPCEICSRTARRQSSAPLHRLDARDRRSSAMSRFVLLEGSACPPVPEMPVPAATIVGPGDETGGDRVAQRGDAVDVGAEVAHGGEAGLERAARVVDADQQVVLDVAVVRLEPRAHLVVVAEDVDVRVDQPRQHELALEIDQPRAGRRRDVAVANRVDARSADDDRRRAARRLARTIEQRAGVDDDDGFGWRLRQHGDSSDRASKPAHRSRRVKS